MNVADRIKKAHVAIMRHKKFCAYGGILACGEVKLSEDIPTAMTNGWDVTYNPKFIESDMADDAHLRFLVLHEATHKFARHMYVYQDLAEENAQLANIAMDHYVNLALQDDDAGEGFIKMPPCGVQPDPKYRGWSTRQIYNDLKQNPPPKGGGSGKGMDEHGWDDAKTGDPKEAAKQAEDIQRAVRQGEMVRKRLAGKGAGDALGAFGEVLAPKVDWRKVLREFITETCSGRDESSWSKPNRRYMDMGIIMPTMVGTTLPELVVGFDTSGSVFGGAEMTRFVSEISTIIENVRPNKVHVIYWDTRVAGHQTFEDGQFAVQDLKVKGGGGTDGSVLFDYLRDKRMNPTAIVQFTDGYVGDWGRSDWPTLWAITSNIRSPYGVSIPLEV